MKNIINFQFQKIFRLSLLGVDKKIFSKTQKRAEIQKLKMSLIFSFDIQTIHKVRIKQNLWADFTSIFH